MKDDISNKVRAEILVQALPYIQSYRNKTVVVKYGGNAMINEELKASVIHDLIFMTCAGIRVVLVHGGGPEIDTMLKKTGKESRFVKGLRYTDEETMEIVQMVLCGKVNKDICTLIQQAGGRAIGLCGLDGALLKARRLKTSDGEDLGLVGEIESVDVSLLNSVLDTGTIPVVSSVAYGIGEDEGHTGGEPADHRSATLASARSAARSLNVNADTAAAKIAAALGAEKLILITDVRGILKDVNDPDSLVSKIRRSDLDSLKKEGIVSKGMMPKVDCCSLALDGGVKRAHMIDGRLPHALLIELFTNEGIGTMISNDI